VVSLMDGNVLAFKSFDWCLGFEFGEVVVYQLMVQVLIDLASWIEFAS